MAKIAWPKNTMVVDAEKNGEIVSENEIPPEQLGFFIRVYNLETLPGELLEILQNFCFDICKRVSFRADLINPFASAIWRGTTCGVFQPPKAFWM